MSRRPAVALLAAAVLLSGCSGGDDVGRTTTTATPATTTAPSPTTTPTAAEDAGAPADAVHPAGAGVADPAALATSFATEYLRMRSPVVGAFQRGDARSGEVPVRPIADGPVTTVLVRQLGGVGDDRWHVVGAATEAIEVSTPTTGARVGSPMAVTGRAFAFEGHVDVEVRQDGVREPIGTGFVTGGGDELRPFAGSVEFRTSTATHGALVLLTTSADDGGVWQATVLRIAFGSACHEEHPEPAPGQMVVRPVFSCEGTTVDAPRLVDRTTAVLGATLEALLEGPTGAERARGFTSPFGPPTAGALRSVRLGSDGHAVVDLADLRGRIPNASSSAGSRELLAQLDGTVFRFPTVRSAEYRFEGSCEAFTEWVQLGGCERRTR